MQHFGKYNLMLKDLLNCSQKQVKFYIEHKGHQYSESFSFLSFCVYYSEYEKYTCIYIYERTFCRVSSRMSDKDGESNRKVRTGRHSHLWCLNNGTLYSALVHYVLILSTVQENATFLGITVLHYFYCQISETISRSHIVRTLGWKPLY